MRDERAFKRSLKSPHLTALVAYYINFSIPTPNQVAVRVRPLFDSNDVPCLQVTPNAAILFDDGSGSRNKFRRYVFDHVFDDKSNQELVYQKTTAALVKDVLNGFSAAVFAYGMSFCFPRFIAVVCSETFCDFNGFYFHAFGSEVLILLFFHFHRFFHSS
jgi:hypothetical protein